MTKNISGYKLSRDTNQRKALFKGLMNALILHEKIETTLTKARAVKGKFEKLVTKSKVNSITSRRALIASLGMENTASKMLDLIGPRFKERHGGYVRLIRLGNRRGDNAPMVRIEFVEDITPVKEEPVKAVATQEKPKMKVTRTRKATPTKEEQGKK